jgi:hypothetical protein
VKENVSQNFAFGAGLTGSDAGHDDALGIDHFAHDTARRIGSRGENGGNAQLLGSDLLKIPEEHV